MKNIILPAIKQPKGLFLLFITKMIREKTHAVN